MNTVLGRLCWKASGRLAHRVGACAGPSSGTWSWGLLSSASPCENSGSGSRSRRRWRQQPKRQAARRQVGRAWRHRRGQAWRAGLVQWLTVSALRTGRLPLAANKRQEIPPGRSLADPGPREELCFGAGGQVSSWLSFDPSLPSAEPYLERPSPTRPLQRQTTWAGRSLRDPASPMGRLVKSGSLGSARGAQPTVEAGVAHSECPHPTPHPLAHQLP